MVAMVITLIKMRPITHSMYIRAIHIPTAITNINITEHIHTTGTIGTEHLKTMNIGIIAVHTHFITGNAFIGGNSMK